MSPPQFPIKKPTLSSSTPPTPPPPPPSSSLPDIIFTAFYLFILISSPKPITNLFHKYPPPLLSFPQNPRRFLSIPIMSVAKKNPSRHNFATPQALSDWLTPRLPSDSFASWGIKPGTKNVHNLWLELSEGETSLADSTPPVRTLEVVIVRVIGNKNQILIESHQELSDGSIRYRSRPLSEKMKPGETLDAAVIRAVREELGSIIKVNFGDSDGNGDGAANVRIVPNSYSKKVEERVSVSYPGLPACYLLHTVDALVDGLPEGEFCTEEGEEYEDSDEKKLADGAVSCKKHYWKWVDSDSV